MSMLSRLGDLSGKAAGLSVFQRAKGSAKEIAFDKMGVETWNEAVQTKRAIDERRQQRGRTETFDAACLRQGVSVRDLPIIQDKIEKSARLFRYAGIATVATAIFWLLFAQDLLAVVAGLVGGFSTACLFFVLSLRDSYRAWQVSARKLAPWVEFEGAYGGRTGLIAVAVLGV